VPSDPPPPRGWPDGFGVGADERRAILTLSELRGLLPRRLHEAAWALGSARACVRAVASGPLGSARDREWLPSIDPDATRDAAERAGARVVTPVEDEYEDRLLDLRDPPVCLFLIGKPLGEQPDRVAIVGARRCSHLGGDVAEDLGRALVASGLGVVSGAAHGIDAAAHRGALHAGGRTVAVLGSGIDVPYPAGNRALLEDIARHGTVVSEYPPGVPAEPQRFPARNRIVVALARALVVVEGAGRSGSRISVDHALDIGREVFAVPGPVNSPLAETPLEMIRDGATLIRGADDLLHDLGVDPAAPPAPPPDLGAAERRIWAALGLAWLPDAIAREAGIPLADAVTALIELELRGVIVSQGGRYQRRHTARQGRPSSSATLASPTSG
jgi:DNA processing protein